MIQSTTVISDALNLLAATYSQLLAVYDPDLYNPLCLCGAAACEGVVEEMLTSYSPDLFTEFEIALVMDVHNLSGEIIEQYDRKEISE
jgi:hypothetical protein